MSFWPVVQAMQEELARGEANRARQAKMAAMTWDERRAFEEAERTAEISRQHQALIDHFAKLKADGEGIYAARLALGDFEPKKEQTFWQWVFGRRP